MEVASLQHLGDSFPRGWLNRSAQAMPQVADADLGYSFGSSRSPGLQQCGEEVRVRRGRNVE
jgi:hypothetical protein